MRGQRFVGTIRLSVVAVSVVGLVWLVGCQQTPKQRTVQTEVPSECICTEAPASQVTQYFPTGCGCQDAMIKLDKSAPSQVRVNQPFTYDIRVTNVSKYDLWDVVVTDTAPQVVKIDGSTPQADMSREGWLTYKVGELPAGQTKDIQIQATASSETCLRMCTEVSYRTAAHA